MDLMSIAELLGNFGEFLGAIAVVATLAYLAKQIRDQNRANHIAAFEGLMDGFNELNEIMASQPGIYRVFMTGLNKPDELDNDDAGRFASLLRLYFNNYHKMYRAYVRGAIEKDDWARYAAEGAQLMESPGGRLFVAGYEKGRWDYIEALREHLSAESVIDLSLGREGIRRAVQR